LQCGIVVTTSPTSDYRPYTNQLGQSPLTTTITFFSDGQLDTLTLWQTNPWLGALTNDENVAQTSGEGVAEYVLDVDNIETTMMTFTVNNHTNTTHVTTTSYQSDVTSLKLDKVNNLAILKIKLDGIVDLDEWVWITNCTTIVCDSKWDTLGTKLNLLDLAQLVLGFFSCDAVNGEATLGVVQQAEVLTSLLNGNHIHKTSWVGTVSADLTIYFNQALHKNACHLITVQRILETVAQENNEWQTLAQFVWTSGWSWSLII
jgi:hypothetical protein